MLSILACYGVFAAIPGYVFMACFAKEDLLTRHRSASRPSAWVMLVLVIILAIDFMVLHQMSDRNWGLQLYLFDAGVVLIPLIYGTLAKHSILDLWILGGIVGIIGTLTIPPIVVH
jgi:cytochrome bd-type quinol oxidase subunit 2